MKPLKSIQSLKLRIQQIQALYKIAPENTWISSYNVYKKNGKRYTYYRLMTKHPRGKGTKMVLYLGSESSKEYNGMVAAIARRNQIKEMEREIARLEKLERVGGGKKQNQPQPTYYKATHPETTLILQLQTQFNQVMKALEELMAKVGDKKSM